VTCARVVVAAQRPIRAVRYGVLIATGLVVLAAIKPWGATPPPAAREPLQPAPVAISPASAVPRPVESPVSSICHDSSSWRVATEGSFVGSQLREWAFVNPVPANGPSDPSIPFVVFSFTRLRVLGYCAPGDAQHPVNLQVLVFRLEASGSSTAVAVQRETRTPASSIAGLFSIAAPNPSRSGSPPPPGPTASWPPGRYVFAVRGRGLGDVWFGAEVRDTTAAGAF
jgi:hypothetical protein